MVVPTITVDIDRQQSYETRKRQALNSLALTAIPIGLSRNWGANVKDSHNLVLALQRHGLGTWPERPTTVQLTDGAPAQPDDPRALKYAQAGLDRECETVKAAIEGTRNDTLNRASYKVGTLVGAGLVDGDSALAALTTAGTACGLTETEVDRTVARSIADGARHPRRVVLTDMDIGDAYVITLADARGTVAELETDTLYPEVDWRHAFETARDDIDWLTYPVMESGRLYALYSPAKAGKSLLTLDICAALASGRPCLGNPAMSPVDVVYVDLENNITDLVERLTDMGYGWQDLNRLHYHSFPSLPALDSRQGGVHMTALATRHSARLVVIDTVSRIIQGKESEADTFHALYRYAMAPLKSMGITVLRLDHSGKDIDKGMRGSSAKTTDVDVAWQLDRVGDSRMRLNRKETRSANAPETVLLEQMEDPLRHVILPSGTPDTRITDGISVLNKLDIPLDWGREKVRTALTGTGYKFSNAVLSEVIRARRIAFAG